MARLPDATALGGIPAPASGRQISGIDGSAIAQGYDALSQGLRAEARGLNIGGTQFNNGMQDIAQSLEKAAGKSDDLTDLQTRGDFSVAKINLEHARDNERDPAVLATYPDKFKALQDQFASKYQDPTRKQKFLIDTSDGLAKSNARTGDLALNYTRDGVYATSLDKLKEYAAAGAKATDPAEKENFRLLGQKQFDVLERDGVLTKSQAVEARQKWVENYSIETLQSMPPEKRLAAVRGWKGALSVSESSMNPKAENDLGYAGIYQFGAPRLQTLGLYRPGYGENLQNWSTTSKAAPGKWSGEFAIPGFPDVKTKEQFLSNPAAQEAVFQIHQQKMDQEIAANGFDKYIGKTVGGVPITRESLYAMMHLSGVGTERSGTKAFLESDGKINTSDGHKTVGDYARLGQEGPSPMAQFITPSTLRKIEDGAVYDLMKQNEAANEERRIAAGQQKAQMQMLQNDLEVGLHDGIYTRADIMKARSDGWLTDYDAIKKVEGIAAAKEQDASNEHAWNEVSAGRRWLNPAAKEDQDVAEAGMKSLVKNSGGQISEPQAAMAVYEKTRVMPKAGAVALNGILRSQDPDRVKEAASVASNVLASNPSAFRGLPGADDIESDASAFKHFAYDLGLGPDVAAKKIIESKTDEYKRNVKVNDNEAKKFKDDLQKKAISDLENGTFEGSGWVKDNIVGANPAQRTEAAMTYSELATDNYQQYGDAKRAKAFALDKMKKLYGISNGVLTKYPAEMAYPQIEKSHDYIYKQAVAYIQTRHPGETIDPKSIQLRPVLGNKTQMEFLSGGQPPYVIEYAHKVNGQTIHDTMPLPWRPDVKSAANEVAAEQEQKFNKARQDAENRTKPPPIEVNPRSWAPGRPNKSAEQIASETAAAQAERDRQIRDAKDTGTRSQAGGAGTVDERNARIKEGLQKASEGEQRPSFPGVSDWIANTPPLRDALPKIQLGPNRNRLPGKPN